MSAWSALPSRSHMHHIHIAMICVLQTVCSPEDEICMNLEFRRLACVPAESKVWTKLVEVETPIAASNLTTKWLNSERFLLGFTMLQRFSFHPHASVVSVQLLPFGIDYVCGVAFGNITPPSGPFPVRIHVRATGMNSNTLTARVIHTAGLRFELFRDGEFCVTLWPLKWWKAKNLEKNVSEERFGTQDG